MTTQATASLPQSEAQRVHPNGFTVSVLFWLRFVRQPQKVLVSTRARYGSLVRMDHDGQAFVIALAAEAAKPILAADPGGYTAFWKEPFRAIAGSGSIWVMDGSRHHRERQLLAPPFHGPSVAGYGRAIRELARLHSDAWRAGQTVRAFETTASISQDVIMRLVFGTEDAAFLEEGHRLLTELLRAVHPSIVFIPMLQKPWFPLWRRHLRARQHFSAWLGRSLAGRRANPGPADDVLGRMLEARYEDGTRMSDEDIRDELYTILLAGHSTTAAATAWALYELGRNPPVLSRLRREVAALGPDPEPGLVAKLPYLSAVCNETLRLHTILSEVGRLLAAPLEVLGYTLPAGDAVVVSINAIHHDPALYPDPDAFIPERFLERTYSPFEFLPFGGGHRRCIGAALSDYEVRISLAEIVMRWDFEPATVEHDVRHDIGMGPRKGVRLRILGRRSTGPDPIQPGIQLDQRVGVA
jgi:cytochrome P450